MQKINWRATKQRKECEDHEEESNSDGFTSVVRRKPIVIKSDSKDPKNVLSHGKDLTEYVKEGIHEISVTF